MAKKGRRKNVFEDSQNFLDPDLSLSTPIHLVLVLSPGHEAMTS